MASSAANSRRTSAVIFGIPRVRTTFPWREGARRDDTDDFDVVFFKRRIGDADENAPDLSDCLPADFSMFVTFYSLFDKRIAEYLCCEWKTDPVLASIRFCL